jgi:hypothetical protein
MVDAHLYLGVIERSRSLISRICPYHDPRLPFFVSCARKCSSLIKQFIGRL